MSGFTGTGFLFRETLAGAAEFTGAAGAGQVTFAGAAVADYGLGAAERTKAPRVKWIGYDSAGDAHEVSFRLVRAAAEVAGGERVRVGGSQIQADGTLGLTNEATVIFGGDGIPVATQDPSTGAVTYYQLQVITSGKTAAATLTVWYDFGDVG